MAAVCAICGKGPLFGNNVSHAHNVTKRKWNPNLQRVRVIIKGAHKRARVCTACIRGGRVVKSH